MTSESIVSVESNSLPIIATMSDNIKKIKLLLLSQLSSAFFTDFINNNAGVVLIPVLSVKSINWFKELSFHDGFEPGKESCEHRTSLVAEAR